MKRRLTAAVLGLACGLSVAVIVILNKPKPQKQLSSTNAAPVDPDLARPEQLRLEKLPEPFDALKRLAKARHKAVEGDWLEEYPEDGQSLGEYSSEYAKDHGKDLTIYFVPVGTFTPAQQRVFDRAVEVTTAFYQRPVKVLPALDPEKMRPLVSPRPHEPYGEQWLAPAINDELVKLQPKDSVGLLGITAVDLYPDPTWNFVFGQAHGVEKVGVMSMARHGDPNADFSTAARRMSAIAVHELGHMFGVHHCVAYECVMNGSNSQQESDSEPMEPCPADTAKLARYFGFDPKVRAAAVRDLYRDAGFTEDADFAAKEAELLSAP
ncbi:MAG: archaemetzincin [Myxococcaceae bacterium]